MAPAEDSYRPGLQSFEDVGENCGWLLAFGALSLLTRVVGTWGGGFCHVGQRGFLWGHTDRQRRRPAHPMDQDNGMAGPLAARRMSKKAI